MPIIEPEFMELTANLDLEAFWAEKRAMLQFHHGQAPLSGFLRTRRPLDLRIHECGIDRALLP